MKPTPISDSRPTSAAERALRERGAELLLRLTAILRVARAYSVTNQVFRNQLVALSKTLKPLFDNGHEAIYVAFEGGLFLNGVRIPTSSGNYRHAQTLVTELEKRGIAGFETRGEPSIDEWLAFFEVFLDPSIVPGKPFVEALTAHGLEHLFVALRFVDDGTWGAEDLFGSGVDGKGSSRGTGPGPGPGAGPVSEVPHDEEGGAPPSGGHGGRYTPHAVSRRGVGPVRYSATLQGIQSILNRMTSNDGVELRNAKRILQPLIDGVREHDPMVLGLVGLLDRDDMTYARTIDTVVISIAIGHRLDFDRLAQSDLAVAALLHGVGRSDMAPSTWGIEGARRIAQATSFNRTTLRAIQVAFEVDPRGSDSAKPGVMSQIVAIASTYARLVSGRKETVSPVTPAQAMGLVLGPLSQRFSPALRAALVQSLGFHPPGQYVELDSGEIALVVSPNEQDLDRPNVRVVWGPDGRVHGPGERWEGGPLSPERWIARDLTAAEVPDLDDDDPEVDPRWRHAS